MTHLIGRGDSYQENVCIVIPCDSIEACIVVAFDKTIDAEMIENPWESIISRKKTYHNIRIRKSPKNKLVFRELAEVVCRNWSYVLEICESARAFECDIQRLTQE